MAEDTEIPENLHYSIEQLENTELFLKGFENVSNKKERNKWLNLGLDDIAMSNPDSILPLMNLSEVSSLDPNRFDVAVSQAERDLAL